MATSGAPAGESVCTGRPGQPRPRWLAGGPVRIPCRGSCLPARARPVGGAVPLQLSPERRLLGGGGTGGVPDMGGWAPGGARAGAKEARYESGAAGASRPPVRAQLSVPLPRNQVAAGRASAGATRGAVADGRRALAAWGQKMPTMDPEPLVQPDRARAHGGRCRVPATSRVHRTPAAGRSRVAAAACVTAAAVAHARTVSNPGLFVPTVNRGVEV